jgi:hypothetical protein
MDYDGFYVLLWRDLRAPEPNLLLRLAISIVMALMLLALGLAGAWGFAHSTGCRWVLDEHIVTAMVLASICWFVMLMVIWRPMRRGRRFVVPSIATIALAVASLAGMFAIDELLRSRDEDFLMMAVLFMGSAAVILVWLPTMQRLLRGKSVIGPDNLVSVHCPHCGYSLIGLRNLRCPECGTEFTIDELIRSQGYRGVEKVSSEEVERIKWVKPA